MLYFTLFGCSFAVVLWEMLSRKIPLLQANGEGEENHFSLLYAIAKGTVIVGYKNEILN